MSTTNPSYVKDPFSVMDGGKGAEEEPGAALRAASEEYAIECSLIKFWSTEVLDEAVDEALQIHGGFGYSEEFPVARFYRVGLWPDAPPTYALSAAITRYPTWMLLQLVFQGRLFLGNPVS